MTPKLFNIARSPNEPYTLIGRSTPWGNPFIIGKHGDRHQCVTRFEREILPGLDVRMLRGQNLACYCVLRPLTLSDVYGRVGFIHDDACHGESILRKANLPFVDQSVVYIGTLHPEYVGKRGTVEAVNYRNADGSLKTDPLCIVGFGVTTIKVFASSLEEAPA